MNVTPIKPAIPYIGGKSKVVTELCSYFPETDRMLSPFMGGGSIEISCAYHGIQVTAFDAYTPIVEFWQALLQDSRRLAETVAKYFYPINKDIFNTLKARLPEFPDLFTRAAAYYAISQNAFSASGLSAGMRSDTSSYTIEKIARLADYDIPNLTVNRMEFQDSLSAHTGMFTYLDPPYLIEANIYGKDGDLHDAFDHNALFDLLKDRKQWILSYNNHPSILSLYSDFPKVFPTWTYTAGTKMSGESREVLIFSRDLPCSKSEHTNVEEEVALV